MTRFNQRHTRRAGVLATVGLVVEGDAEFEALPLLHKKKLIPGCPPLKASNLGGVGSDRKPVGIAKLVAPKVIAHQQAGRTHVVVCLDREQRPECAPEFAQQVQAALSQELVARNKPVEGVQVVISDRAFEAWLLAGARGLHARGVLKAPLAVHCFEGQMGIEGRKGVGELTKLLGREYSKTKDGPSLFEKLDFPAARSHRNSGHGSKSLDKFLRTLGI